jgi:hypothetical protein
MREGAVEALAPRSRTDHGVYLGGFKPAVTCDLDARAFQELLRREG